MAEPFQVPIPVSSNPSEFTINGKPRVFNAYAVIGSGDQKSKVTLVPSTGLVEFSSDASAEGACRGMIYLENSDVLFTVNGIHLYSFDSVGTGTKVGLMTGADPIIWARNKATTVQVLIHSDNNIYKLIDGVLGYVNNPLPDGQIAAGVTLVGGYFVLWTDSGKMYTSDLNDIVFDPLNFATAESDPDGLTGCIGIQNTLYAIGTKSTEVWQIDGTTGFPLSRVPGASVDFGSLSKHTIKEIDNEVFFVGSDDAVHVMRGYESKPISTNEISRLIEAETDKNAIVAFTHTRSDNKFYTLQGTGWTREFNTKTQAWHDRYSDPENQWVAMHHQRGWNNRDFFGDRNYGRIFEGDYDIHTEPDNPVVWGFATTLIHNFPQGLSFAEADLDVETGHSEIGETSALMFRWSNNGGRTWMERQLPLGKQGEWNKKVSTKRLGSCDETGRMFEIKISDPVIRAISEFTVDARGVRR